MARIRGTFVTNLQGRVGGVVYRYRDGKAIASARPATVKNPKTAGQVLQRVIMGTCFAAQQALSSIVDHSFEAESGRAKSLALFCKYNAKNLRQQTTLDSKYFMPKNGKGVTLFPFMISKGTLQTNNSLSVAFKNVTAGMTFTAVYVRSNGIAYAPVTGEEMPTGATLQITQITIAEDWDGTEDTLNNAINIILNTENGTVEYANGSITFTPANTYDEFGFAVISSIKEGDSWKYSTEKLKFGGNMETYNFTLNNAMNSYGVETDNTLDQPTLVVQGEQVIWINKELKKASDEDIVTSAVATAAAAAATQSKSKTKAAEK